MPLNSPTHNRAREGDPEGRLYVVSTPIGHMDDITVRALEILGKVDRVAAEDTRHTGKLLARHGIKTPLVAYHEHNEREQTPGLIRRMSLGESIALVTDAGTPSVSDPGYRLVRAAADHQIRVVPVPGVSAAVTALSVSGLPTDTFVFVGFPQRKKTKRAAQLADLSTQARTLIFYESPRRILRLLEDVRGVMGDRQAVLCREMTKLHEEFFRGTLSEIAAGLEQRPRIKGECTLVVSGETDAKPPSMDGIEAAIATALRDKSVRPTDVSKQIAAQFGLNRSKAYEAVLRVRDKREPPESPDD